MTVYCPPKLIGITVAVFRDAVSRAERATMQIAVHRGGAVACSAARRPVANSVVGRFYSRTSVTDAALNVMYPDPGCMPVMTCVDA